MSVVLSYFGNMTEICFEVLTAVLVQILVFFFLGFCIAHCLLFAPKRRRCFRFSSADSVHMRWRKEVSHIKHQVSNSSLMLLSISRHVLRQSSKTMVNGISEAIAQGMLIDLTLFRCWVNDQLDAQLRYIRCLLL